MINRFRDEDQRRLDEIERELVAVDPWLAARLAAGQPSVSSGITATVGTVLVVFAAGVLTTALGALVASWGLLAAGASLGLCVPIALLSHRFWLSRRK